MSERKTIPIKVQTIVHMVKGGLRSEKVLIIPPKKFQLNSGLS